MMRPIPPSSNRTCGFPASGFPGNSRLGYTQAVAHLLLRLSAQFLSQIGEFLQKAYPAFRFPGWGNVFQIFREGALAQAVLLSFRQNHVSGQAPWLHGHYSVSLLLWACPTPDQGRRRVMSFPVTVGVGPLPVGSPRFLGRSFGARCPLPPRRARQLHAPVASLPTAGFSTSERLATLDWRNEAEPGSLTLRLAPSLARGFARWDYSRPTPEELYVEQAIT